MDIPSASSPKESSVTKATLPAGKYFIGDPVYGMSETMYSNFFGQDGTKDMRGDSTAHLFRKTTSGETLEGNDGLSYDIAHVGRIGIMSAGLVDWTTYGQYQRDLPAQIYTFPTPVTVRLDPTKERYSFSWKDLSGYWNELVLRRENDWSRLKETNYMEV